MSTDIAIRHDTALSVADDQAAFSEAQVTALRHIGVEGATQADLDVFFHVVKRTGLDPFARQIHMISRQVSERDPQTGEWVKVPKQTIQTGIDGYRLIGRRAADRSHDTISIGAPEWAHEDGSWRPVWSTGWGLPIAARVTIHRSGQPFTAVALFDEYKQTKRNGDLTSMWGQRPAGQLAKCAEALAWRMAFPQDLAGMYVDEEMQHADSAPADRPAPRSVAAFTQTSAEPVERPAADASPASDVPGSAESDRPGISRPQLAKVAAQLRDLGMTERDPILALVSDLVGREVSSRNDLSSAEASMLIDYLDLRLAQAAEPEVDGAAS